MPAVEGYKVQTQNNIGNLNANKKLEELILQRLDVITTMPNVDKRFLAIGRTHLEIAFMCINRAIFTPERAKFSIGDDELVREVHEQWLKYTQNDPAE